MAAVDNFLKIDAIEGETEDHKHKGEIEVLSWSWSESNSGTMASGGGGGAGKVSMQDFEFQMATNKASPALLQACANGQHFKKAVLTCRKAGKEQQEYLKITFSDVMISSFRTAGAGGDPKPTDGVKLNFAKIEYEYRAQRGDGTLEAAIQAGWDLKQNKAFAG